MALKLFICVCIGYGFGWFAANEWEECQKKKVSEWKEIETKILVTKDIPILDWRGK